MRTRSSAVLAGFSPPVPDAVARRAAAYPLDGPPAEARPAASVVLMRDSVGAVPGEVQVYLLHRHSRMPFAASMAVFPGGRLDPADQGFPDPLLACACRETEEETGVRLDPGTVLPWAHWITPEHEPLRFDTHFYVARLPEGQEAADLSGETERAGWLGVHQTLEQRERSALSLMPPTWAILAELDGLLATATAQGRPADVGVVLAAARDRVVETVLPRLVPTVSGWAYEYQVLPG